MFPQQTVLGAAPLPAADAQQALPSPRSVRHGFSGTSSSGLSGPAPGAGRAGGCLRLCPQEMLAPAGYFVSVALLPDLSCFLPRGCRQRKCQPTGFPLSGSQLQSWAGDGTVAVGILGPLLTGGGAGGGAGGGGCGACGGGGCVGGSGGAAGAARAGGGGAAGGGGDSGGATGAGGSGDVAWWQWWQWWCYWSCWW